jgi:anti-sigma factor ChrR (cupin superfamily)
MTMTSSPQSPSLDNWDIKHNSDVDWLPWGSGDNARVKVLGEADGHTIALIQAEAGYKTAEHQHAHAEFFYLVEGSIRNEGQQMNTGDGYAAASGSVHTEFEVQGPSTYISIFRR